MISKYSKNVLKYLSACVTPNFQLRNEEFLLSLLLRHCLIYIYSLSKDLDSNNICSLLSFVKPLFSALSNFELIQSI